METKINEIVNGQGTKTQKMTALFELGKTRKEVAELMNVGYGFAQNVFAKLYGVKKKDTRNPKFTHTFIWGKHPQHIPLKGLKCKIVATHSSTYTIILENGWQYTCPRLAIRAIK